MRKWPSLHLLFELSHKFHTYTYMQGSMYSTTCMCVQKRWLFRCWQVSRTGTKHTSRKKTVFLPVSTFLFLPSSILSLGCCCSFSSFLFSITHLLSFCPLFLPGLITLSTFPSLLCLFTHNSLASSFLPRVCLCHSSFISPQFHPLWVLSSHLCHLSSIFKHHLQTVVSSLISSGRPDASSVSTFQQICKGRPHTRFTWYCGLFFWWI